MGQYKEEDLEEEKPLKTAFGEKEQVDMFKDRVVIRGKGLANGLNVRAVFAPAQIKSMVIKPAGTLYNGNMEITAAGVRYIVEFKQYQQPDFEEIKILLTKQPFSR